MWKHKVEVAFLQLASNPVAEGCRKPKGEILFLVECHKALRKLLRSNDFSRSRGKLYLELVLGTASDPLGERLDRRFASNGIGRLVWAL